MTLKVVITNQLLVAATVRRLVDLRLIEVPVRVAQAGILRFLLQLLLGFFGSFIYRERPGFGLAFGLALGRLLIGFPVVVRRGHGKSVKWETRKNRPAAGISY